MHIVLVIVLHFAVYSLPAVIGSFLERRTQIHLMYTYLGTLFTLTQIFDSVYAINIGDNLYLNGGDIAYSSLIFAAVYLVFSQPKPRVVRNLIYINIIIGLFLFSFFALLIGVLDVYNITDYPNISEIFLEFSWSTVLYSLFLFCAEVIIILVLLRFLVERTKSHSWISMGIGLIYFCVILLDGILYPIGNNLLVPGLNYSVANSIYGKLIFGAGYGTILILILNIRPRNFPSFIHTNQPLRDYLIPPTVSQLEEELEEKAEEIHKLRQILPICARCKKIRDDEGYWNQIESYFSKHQKVDFSHGLCPDCEEKAINALKNRNKTREN